MAETSSIVTRNARNNTIVNREVINDYNLNIDKALAKKLEATKRQVQLVYKQTNGGIVITADAATFELIRHATMLYYSKFPVNIGSATIQKQVDKSRKTIVQWSIKVMEKNSMAYTINLYFTRLMINGKSVDNFLRRDMKEIQTIVETATKDNNKINTTKLNELMRATKPPSRYFMLKMQKELSHQKYILQQWQTLVTLSLSQIVRSRNQKSGI